MMDYYGENDNQSLFPLYREGCKRKPARNIAGGN